MINLIVCMGKNREIGKEGDMPWKRGLPEDLAYFKRVTSGHAVVMGRKTYESIGFALPNRKNMVLTRDVQFSANNCEIYHTVEEILTFYKENEEEFFIIGGAEIYKMFLPYAKRLYITEIKQEFEADTFFPSFDKEEYDVIKNEKGVKNVQNPYDYQFVIYEKKHVVS
jgi:dihydrofolate reductase